MIRDELWYWFVNINRIGLKKCRMLIDYFEDIEAIWKANSSEIMEGTGLSEKDVEAIKESKKEDNIKRQYDNILSRNIRFVSVENPEYPSKLKNIIDYPYGLYVMGKAINSNELAIAVIGTRNCSEYGREMAEYLGKELAKQGVIVISGLAKGIDAHSHRGAIYGGGHTIGVIGNGLDISYPLDNFQLMEQMKQVGTLVSEYNLGTKPTQGNFPMRNRIISGMSDGIVVVESKEKGGSLITVNQALEQGKDIFAVAGRAFDKSSEGCNELIKQGAKLVTNVYDILEEYREINNRKIAIDNEFGSQVEKAIYALLDFDLKSVDYLEIKMGIPINEILQGLLQLEIKGKIRRVGNANYIKTINY